MASDPARSGIAPDTIAAYRATDYRVDASQPFVLRVGQASPELAALYASAGVGCCAYITACNPHSRQVDPATNNRRQAALAQELRHCGCVAIPGVGQHPHNLWPGEPSFLALGLSLDAAKALARRHGQDAFVWCGPDTVAGLVLLR